MEWRPEVHIKIINLYKWHLLKQSIKIDRLLANVFDSQLEIMFQEFARYILNLYKSLLLHAIKNQKFPKKYPPLSPAYVKYKKENRMHKGFWQATGFSQSNLTVWRLKKNNYAIGFKKNLEHPAAAPGVTVAQINRWVEKGTVKMPPRPLYWPIARSIQRHIYDVHFKNFIRVKYPEWYHLLD